MNNKNTLFFILLAASILNVDCCRAAAAAPQDTPEFHDFIRDIAKGNEERIVQTLLQHPTFLEHTVPYSVMENHSKDEDKPTLKAMFNKLPIKPFDIAYLLRHYDIARSLHKRGHVSFDKMNLSNIFTFLIKRDKTKELEYILNNSTNVEDALLAQAIAKNRKNVDVEDWITRTYKDKIEAAEKNNLLVVKQKGSSLQPVDPSKIAQFAKQAQASRGVQTPAIQAPDQKDQEFHNLVVNKTLLFLYLQFKEFDKARALLTQDPSLANGPFTQKMIPLAESYLDEKIGRTYNGKRTPVPSKDQTPVGLVIASGDTEGLRMLHKEFAADLNAYPKEGTALHLAARAGHQGIIKYLLEIGFDLTQPNPQGKTPFQIAKNSRIANFIQEYQSKQEADARPTSSSLDDIDDIFAEIEATGAPSKQSNQAITQSKKPKAKKKKPKTAALKHKPTPPAQSNKQADEKLPEQPIPSPAEEQQPPQQAVQEKAPAQKPPLLPAAKALSQAQAQQQAQRQEKLRKEQQEEQAKLRKEEEEEEARLAKEAAEKKAVEQAQLLEEARLQAAKQEALHYEPEQEYRAQLSEAAPAASDTDPESAAQLLTLMLHPGGSFIPQDIYSVEQLENLLASSMRHGYVNHKETHRLLNSLKSRLPRNENRLLLKQGEYVGPEDLVELYTTGAISKKQRSNPPLAQASNDLESNHRGYLRTKTEEKERVLVPQPFPVPAPFPVPVVVEKRVLVPQPFPVYIPVHDQRFVHGEPGNYALTQQRR